jgi:hypothetical protein
MLGGVCAGGGVGDGFVGCCLRDFCCGGVAWSLLPKRKPQLGQRPDALFVFTPQRGQLLGFVMGRSMLDGRGIVAHLGFTLMPFSDYLATPPDVSICNMTASLIFIDCHIHNNFFDDVSFIELWNISPRLLQRSFSIPIFIIRFTNSNNCTISLAVAKHPE